MPCARPGRLLGGGGGAQERRRCSVVYGVRDDCLALLQLFEARDSLRFQDFAACWREMMFSHMLRSVKPMLCRPVQHQTS